MESKWIMARLAVCQSFCQCICLPIRRTERKAIKRGKGTVLRECSSGSSECSWHGPCLLFFSLSIVNDVSTPWSHSILLLLSLHFPLPPSLLSSLLPSFPPSLFFPSSFRHAPENPNKVLLLNVGDEREREEVSENASQHQFLDRNGVFPYDFFKCIIRHLIIVLSSQS